MVNVLILCTGNSCRSVLGEALINHLAGDRLRAFSAGSHPLGRINAGALATLKRNGIATEGFTSQSWNEFADAGIDIAITVCDSAAGEACPVYLNSTVRGHWGLTDPAHISGSEKEIAAAFQVTYDALEKRIRQLLALPFETMPAAELSQALNKIGQDIP
ncbi:MAG: arsenate reductase ArsC [Methylococcales bacterium]|nr:arsenate reductase ArsC [Methylococcales bacterium]